MAQIKLKRAYAPQSPDDGFRVYVDRLWPRGLSHENFQYDLWDKDIAPSAALRQWFHEDPAGRWPEFERRYKEELTNNRAVESLRQIVQEHPVVTLLYSSRDGEHNNADVLRDYLLAGGR